MCHARRDGHGHREGPGRSPTRDAAAEGRHCGRRPLRRGRILLDGRHADHSGRSADGHAGIPQSFPDVSNEVTDWIEPSDGVAVEQVITATHTGPWMTPFGEKAPTGKRLRWEAAEFVRIRNDRIV